MPQEPIIRNEIKNSNSTIGWIDDDIVIIKWSEERDIEINDIDELEESFNKLTQGRKVKVLQELGRYTNITPEARNYGAAKSPEVIGIAYVINGLAQRLVLKFYIRMRRNKNPTKVFFLREDALEWLRRL